MFCKMKIFLLSSLLKIRLLSPWVGGFNKTHSHGRTNSCGVLTAIYSKLNICVKNKVNDNDSRVLTLEATIDGSDYMLLNL